MQIVQGKSDQEAVAALKRWFEITKEITITPTGEVRVAGVLDNPKPPRPGQPMPPPPPEPPPAGGEEEEEPGSQLGAEGKKPKAESEDQTQCLPILEAVDRLSKRVKSHNEQRSAKRRTHQEALEHAMLYGRFHKLVNMRPSEIKEHLRSPELRDTLNVTRRSKVEGIRLGQAAVEDALVLKAAPIDVWTPSMWEWCERIVKFIERTRHNSAETVDESGRPTRKTLTLRTWGHDPLREASMQLDEFETLYQYDPAIALRIVDATSTDGPVLIQLREGVNGSERSAPNLKVLKSNRKPLSEEERAKCMKAKAVWHFSGHNKPSPAVWRSVVGENTYYVTNTHRAYNVASTVEGAIERFHRFIKSTA